MIEYQIKHWTRITFSYRNTSLSRMLLRILPLPILTALLMLYAHQWVIDLHLSPITHTILGTALGLLLVFRNNASYDRFWEGRKKWGGIVNDSRNLARSIYVYGDNLASLVPLICSFCHALKHQLRYAKPTVIDQAITPFLAKNMREKLLQHHNVSWMISIEMSKVLQQTIESKKITVEQGQRLETLIASLIDHQGACERILKTPVPFTYTVHVRQLLLIYIMSLPLVLIPMMGWLSVLSVTVIGFGLLGIEEAGLEIEDPFGTDPNNLPLDAICDTICKDVQLHLQLVEKSST